jgi:hypothetical protein
MQGLCYSTKACLVHPKECIEELKGIGFNGGK